MATIGEIFLGQSLSMRVFLHFDNAVDLILMFYAVNDHVVMVL